MIPDWMKVTDTAPCTCSAPAGGRGNFIKKTLDGVFSFFQESFVTGEIAERDGLLQSFDPRAKLISILILVFSISMTKDLRILILFYGTTLIAAYLSRIGLIFFIKRVWLFIPIFTGVIAIPMIFNIFIAGDVLFPLFQLGAGAHIGPFALPESIYITREGLYAACVFTMRVASCVSAVVLLFLTTPQQLLFKSLQSVGVPKVYVLTLEMANRYIFLFMEIIRDLYTAKKSRTIKSVGVIADQRWVGGRIGYMLIKSLDMSEKVHMAMRSRGFSGEVKIMQDFSFSERDYLAAAVSLTAGIALVLASHGMIQV